MNLLTSVELRQCGQSELASSLVSLSTWQTFWEKIDLPELILLPLSCLAHTCFGLYCHRLCSNQHFSLLGPEVKHYATLTVVRVREEATYMV